MKTRGSKASPFFMFIFGAVFAMAGLAVILFLACKTTLICERVQPSPGGTCKLIQQKTFDRKEQEIPVASLLKAYVDEDHDDDGTTYRVTLVTNTDEIPLTQIWSSGYDDKQKISSQINAYIQNQNETSLIVEQDDRMLVYILGGVFFVVGIGIVLGSFISLLSFL
ncbi:MAG: hypothetical protein AB1782_18020 [Cyanobacteriota bacterium]